ncbi:hypothetical protein, partial [Streptomyces acidiscabies]|uniref:hypothetical protein n=1 Tax=Streptomyces acidiscabies TaxID=42234 RepID=UPI0038F60E20
DAVAPPTPEKNVRNPHGIVDILTFCEHPYFLNQRLTPWQKMILKLFYAGTDGNSHLANIDNTRPADEKSCTGCVWNYVRESEEK